MPFEFQKGGGSTPEPPLSGCTTGSTYFFKNQLFSGVGGGCLYVFVNGIPQFLICYNKLHLRVEIILPACLNNNGNLRFSCVACVNKTYFIAPVVALSNKIKWKNQVKPLLFYSL